MDWLLGEEVLERKPLPIECGLSDGAEGAFKWTLELLHIRDFVSLLILTLKGFGFFKILWAAVRII